MGKGSPPAAPDPYQSAGAQYEYGTAAANYGTALNRPNTVTPYGSDTWSTSAQPTGPGYTSTPTGVPNPSGYSGYFYGGGPPPSGAPGMMTTQPIRAGGGMYLNSVPQPGSGAVSTPTQPVGQSFGLGGPSQPGDIVATAPWQNAPPSGGATPPGGGLGPYSPGFGGAGDYGEPNQEPPNYTQAFNLSPAEQALFNLNQGGELGVGASSAGAADTGGYATSVPGMADIPSFTDEARQAAYGQQTQYLDPQFQQQYEQLDAQLRNSGATPGDPAYNNAMTLFNNQRQQAYTNAFNNSVGAGLSEQQGLFGEELGGANFGNQSILAGLNDTGFGGAPSFGLGGGGSGGSVSAPDIMSAFQNQYSGQLAGYNANVASTNQDVGAAASLAALYFLAA